MKPDIKQKIIDAAVRLIQKRESKPEDITVRDICAEAGVGISQINYHFQSKDNLIAQCIHKMIGDATVKLADMVYSEQYTPASEKLKRGILSLLNILYDNENISRVSILADNKEPKAGDNTDKTINAYLPIVKEVCWERRISSDPRKLTVIMVLAMQGLFLRTNTIKESLGIDLRDTNERRKLVDDYVESVFRRI